MRMPFRGSPSAAPAARDLEVYSPEWWRDAHLGPELELRRPLVDLYEDYYEGRHSLAFIPNELRESSGAMLAAVGDNYMPLVVQAAVERMSIQGFTVVGSTEPGGDDDAWEMWHANGLDEHEPQLWTESGKHGEAYLLVWGPEESLGGQPRITLEHPREMIVARDPQDRTRITAALKRHMTDWGIEFANLYLPGRILRYKMGKNGWEPREYDGVPPESPIPPEVGVPVIPIPNEPSMLPSRPPQAVIQWPHSINAEATIGIGRSDQADVLGTQDSLNGVLVAAHSATQFQGFMLRWIIGVEQPVDDNGNEVPIKISPGSVVAMDYDPGAGDPEPKIGQLAGTDLGQFVNLGEQRIQSISSRSRVPVHYLLSGRVQLPSGESLHAAEAGLCSKIAGKKKAASGGLGRAIRTGYLWKGDARAKQRIKPVWTQHEYRTEAERSDAVGKRVQMLGVPREQGWIDAGYDVETRKEMRAMLAQQMIEAQAWAAMGVPDPNAAAPVAPEEWKYPNPLSAAE